MRESSQVKTGEGKLRMSFRIWGLVSSLFQISFKYVGEGIESFARLDEIFGGTFPDELGGK
jgi:hypothetical protein